MRTPGPLLAILLALVAACETSPDAAVAEQADAALKRGDYGQAHELYAKAARVSPHDPLLNEMADMTRRLAKGQAEAANEAEKARPKADDLIKRGDRHLAAGDPVQAFRSYRAALEYLPGYGPAEAALKRARTAALREAEKSASDLLDRGEQGTALGVFEEARTELGLTEIAAEARARADISRDLLFRASLEAGAGRAATAWMLCAAAHAVDPSVDAPDRGRLESAHRVRVAVEEFEDGTAGRMDPAAFRETLTAALEASVPGPWIEFQSSLDGASLQVTGTIRTLTVDEETPVTRQKEREYVIRTEQRENEQRNAVSKKLDEVNDRIRGAEETFSAIRMERFHIEQLRGSTVAQSNWRYGGYSQAAYFRHLARVRTREGAARRAIDKLKSARDDVERQWRAMPVYVEVRIMGKATVTETTRELVARAEGGWNVSGERSATGSGTDVKIVASDTGSPADPSIGLPEDPIELPSAGDLADRALAELAARFAKRIGPAVAVSRKSLLEQARSAADEDAAIDAYVAFVLTAGEAFPLEVRVAAGRIEKRFGILLTEAGPDVSGLRSR